MTLGWTDERVELLKTLWKKGLSASQIAEELGISQVHVSRLLAASMEKLRNEGTRRM